jgi:hypothetical protein
LAGIRSPSLNADDVNDIRALDAWGLAIGLTSGDRELLADVTLALADAVAAAEFGSGVGAWVAAEPPEPHPPTNTTAASTTMPIRGRLT